MSAEEDYRRRINEGERERRVLDGNVRMLSADLARAERRIAELEAEVSFWINLTGAAVDALDECAGDDEEGWNRQQHAEDAARRIRAEYKDR